MDARIARELKRTLLFRFLSMAIGLCIISNASQNLTVFNEKSPSNDFKIKGDSPSKKWVNVPFERKLWPKGGDLTWLSPSIYLGKENGYDLYQGPRYFMPGSKKDFGEIIYLYKLQKLIAAKINLSEKGYKKVSKKIKSYSKKRRLGVIDLYQGIYLSKKSIIIPYPHLPLKSPDQLSESKWVPAYGFLFSNI